MQGEGAYWGDHATLQCHRPTLASEMWTGLFPKNGIGLCKATKFSLINKKDRKITWLMSVRLLQ
jgi:hypothetical protein